MDDFGPPSAKLFYYAICYENKEQIGLTDG